jgi:hypothetical protein
MLYGKFANEGNNPVNNPNIYNVQGENRLSPGLQPLTTGSVFNILFFSFQFRNCIYYSGKYFVVFYKTKHSSLSIFCIIKQL